MEATFFPEFHCGVPPGGCRNVFKGSPLTLGQMADACVYYGGDLDADTKAKPY